MSQLFVQMAEEILQQAGGVYEQFQVVNTKLMAIRNFNGRKLGGETLRKSAKYLKLSLRK